MNLDLYRIRFKDGMRAADTRLVWASSLVSAEALGHAWCAPQGFRLIGAEIETVAREGEPVVAPERPGLNLVPEPADPKKLAPIQVAVAAMAKK